jgi:peptidoglycan/xylan/chitin deacetylase (PgdA/CDA1 family)
VEAVGTFVVSLDFELYWGVQDQRSIEDYGDNLRGARDVVPRLLERFAERGVRATWATVGMLFCESKEELLARLPERRPEYARPELATYSHLATVGADERTDPLHFAPSLIRQIADVEGQEVASHTFSHFYCLEPGQTKEDFDADLRAAVAVAQANGIDLRSIVFPRNQVNPHYLPACAAQGMTAYRGTQSGWMHSERDAHGETPVRRAARLVDAYVPISRGHARVLEPPGPAGMVDVPATRFFRPVTRKLARLEPRKVERMLGEMEDAARTGAVYHLWWHPHNFGVDQDRHFAQLEAVLSRFSQLRAEGRMHSATMAEVASGQGA